MFKNLFRQKQAVIFDFDGTIADTFQLHENAFKEALGGYDVKFDYKDYLGRSTKEAIRAIFESNQHVIDGGELDALIKNKQALANQSYTTALCFMPGALAFIELLHSHHFTLFIGSSGSARNITAGLASLGIDQYFTKVITSNDVQQSKPHPEIFQKILIDFQIDPQAALVIEDAASGIEAAHAAGIDVVCINPELEGNQYKDRVFFSNFPALKNQLQSELQNA